MSIEAAGINGWWKYAHAPFGMETFGWVSEWVKHWVSETLSEWDNEWLKHLVSEIMSEWDNEWVSEWVSEILGKNKLKNN